MINKRRQPFQWLEGAVNNIGKQGRLDSLCYEWADQIVEKAKYPV